MAIAGPLSDVKVIDLTTTMLGPFCSLRLAEFGADVIKIEAPGGDITRQGRGDRPTGSFLNTNAGKRSVVLDLKNPQELDALYELSRGADVFLHNLPAPTARRLGVDPESLREVAPQIVYCAAYGYGEGGPYAGRPAYDDVIQAACGVTSTQHGSVDRPRYVSSPIADKTVGLMAAFAIASALVKRERTGLGGAIEVPMFEVMTSFVLQETLGESAFLPPHGPPGSAVASEFRRPYTTKDGYISVLLFTDEHWKRFLSLIGRADLITDERYRSFEARARHRDEVYHSLDGLLATRTTDEWLGLLSDLKIPCGPVNTLVDVLEDEHLKAVDFFEIVDHPIAGRVRRPRCGVRFDGRHADLGPAPALGEHTESVLRAVRAARS